MAIPARYELKYLIPERLAAPLREAIAPFCELDRHSAAAPDRQYTITSLYLDSATREFHRAKVERQRRRLKLRVRTYGEDADGPVFFEVKRKIDQVVIKGRAPAPQRSWEQRLLGPPPDDAAPAEVDFRAVLERHAARPTLLARYRREAYVSVVDAYARVTLDRRLQYQSCDRWELTGEARGWSAQDDIRATRGTRAGLVLELKATTAVPLWMTALVQRFELLRAGFSKYCTGVDRLWGGQDLSRLGDRAAVYSRRGWGAEADWRTDP